MPQKQVDQPGEDGVRRRLKAAATPRARAMTALTQAVRAPMRMDRAQPRQGPGEHIPPSQSVPNSPSGPGARFVREKSAAVARSVQKRPRHCDRQQDHRREQQQPQGPLPAGSRSSSPGRPPPDLGIHHAVQQVSGQIPGKDDGGGDDGDAQQQREVAPQAGIDRRLSQARDRRTPAPPARSRR